MNDAWVHEKEDWLRKYRLKVDWTDLRGYFRRLRKARPAINVGVMVGAAQGSRRCAAASATRSPTRSSSRGCKQLVEEAMEQGALGLSTGLIYQRAPSRRRTKLIALAQVAAKHGGFYATHLRSEGARIFEALDEAFAIARAASIPLEIWHLRSVRSHWGHMQEVVARSSGRRTASTRPGRSRRASVQRFEDPGSLAAQVGRRRSPVLRGHLRERDQLVRLREGARLVDETVERPSAPCSIASSTSCCIRASLPARRAARRRRPSTTPRTCAAPTITPTLIAGRALRNLRK